VEEYDEEDSSLLNEEDGQPIEEEIFVDVEGGNNRSKEDVTPNTFRKLACYQIPRSASICPQL
jgi:hypothetical protein